VKPPDFAIAGAVVAGRLSECAKSKRGVAVFAAGSLLGLGYNAQPAPLACTGDARCRAACGKLCEHAEQVAIRDALVDQTLRLGKRCETLQGADLVHVKVVDAQLVAGGGPSCWQCSRLVLAVQLDGVWLYEVPTEAEYIAWQGDPSRAFRPVSFDPPDGIWHYYTAEEFHRATLAECARKGEL
jgi:deoxycytidylate deaminase